MTSVDNSFSPTDLATFKEQFESFDLDHNGHITSSELEQVIQSLGEKITLDELQKLIAEVDLDKNGTVEFDEFLAIMSKIRDGKVGLDKGFGRVYAKQVKLNLVEGTTAGTQHSFSDEEKYSFTDYINHTLKNDKHLASQLPIDPESMDLFKAVNNGLLLCKLINAAVPETVDERALNLKPSNAYQTAENLNVAVNSAKGIGCNIINIGADDLSQGKPHLVLGLIWQIIRIGLLSKITLKNHPYIMRLLEPGEELADLLKLSPEQILIRWFNYHLREAGSQRRVANFSGDIKDSEAYTVLLHQIAPEHCDLSALQETDRTKRAGLVIDNAAKLDCAKFLRPIDIVKGNQKLNLAFVANLFNTWPGLEPQESELQSLADLFDDESDAREERAFRMWMNSMGVDPEVRTVFEDLKDGLVMLQLLDKLEPGLVDWRKANRQPNNKFKRVENCNYAVVLAKSIRFSLVGIGGVDVADGNKKLTLAIVWQAMRYYIVKMVQSLSNRSMSKSGDLLSEADMVAWANKTVKAAGKDVQIGSFKDKSLADSKFLVNLCHAIEPRAVDLAVLTPGETDEERKENAKYAISVARKIGAAVFLLWEDIAEVKPKMILTYVGAVMAKYAK